MKYLLVLSWLELGGAERQAINFAEYLQDHGHDVTILGLGPQGQVSDICEIKGIKCISLPPCNDMFTIRYKIRHRLHIQILTDEEIALLGQIHNLAKHINHEKYDVAISYCALANTVLGCAKPKCRQTVCIWYQRDRGVYDKFDGLQPLAAEKMDMFLANGASGIEWLRRAYNKEARLIYNGVKMFPPLMDREEWRKKLNVNDTDIVCTMIAQLTHDSKDHMTLLKAWNKLIPISDKIYFVMAGRHANAYNELVCYAEETGIMEHIRFLGHIEDVYGLLQASDICVFSSRTEGSPNGVIEGCMCELPVIASDTPEIRELLSEENYPYLFPVGDADRAADLILSLATDTELCSALGIANRHKAEEMFDPGTNFETIVRVSGELIESRGKRIGG